VDVLDDEVRLLNTHLGGLPRAVEADQILRQIWLDDVHHSTAIEGNTMTRAQVANLVERGQVTASLVEALEVRGMRRQRTGPTSTRETMTASRSAWCLSYINWQLIWHGRSSHR
jgi:hypothetical protein